MKSGTTFILKDGSIRVIDPGRAMLPLLKSLDPDFEILSDRTGNGFVPGFQKLRQGFIGMMTREELEQMDTGMVWAVHDAVIEGRIPVYDKGQVSIFDLKAELGKRILRSCDLCGLKCKANRHKAAGKCGARANAMCNGIFEHISEEPPINPAWNIKMIWCPMRCAFCQTPENLAKGKEAGPLTPGYWEIISKSKTCSTLEFVGGEPMVSCPGILNFLSVAPKSFALPVVMNCSSYLGVSGVNLMNGAVDVWVPDFTYGDNACAKRLSGVDNYWETATEAISLMSWQDTRVIVRVLILPGHYECCHKKVLEWLYQHKETVWISIMDQFLPLHEAHRHRDISRLPSEEEIEDVRSYARRKGLKDINDEPAGRFWK